MSCRCLSFNLIFVSFFQFYCFHHYSFWCNDIVIETFSKTTSTDQLIFPILVNLRSSRELTTWTEHNGTFLPMSRFSNFHWNKNKPHCSIYHAKLVISKSTKIHKKPTANSWQYGTPHLSFFTKKCMQEESCGLPYFHEFTVGFLWNFLYEITTLAW